MTKKIAEAERVLASLPKRANELTRKELVDIVNQIQVYLYTETDGPGTCEVWNAETDTKGADFIEAVDWLLSSVGLRPGEEFTGQRIRRAE